MAYNPRYEFFFNDDTAASRVYRTQLCDRDYDGLEIVELKHDGDPVRAKMNTSDNWFERIRGMVATIGALSDPASGFEMKDLYTEDDRKWRVFIDEFDDTNNFVSNIFTGYLSPFGAREAYHNGVKNIKLTATCGLGTLKDYSFCVPGTTRPAVGKFSLYYVLRTCLSWLNYELPIRLSMGIIEKSMGSVSLFGGYERPNWPYSVLSSINMDTHRFLTDTGIASCHEVLSELLKILKATIVQYPGYWRIVRVDEYAQYIADDGYAPVLVYEQPSNFQFYGSREKIVRSVNRTGIGTPLATGELSVAPSEKKLTVKFEYGDLYNELKNGDFSQGLANWTDPVTNWPTPPAGLAVADGNGSEDRPYGIKIKGTTNNFRQHKDDQYVVQALQFPAWTEGTSDEFTLKITFINIKNAGAKIGVHAQAGEKYRLQEDGTWGWYGGSKEEVSWYIFKLNTYKDENGRDAPKPTEGETIELTMTRPPGMLPYTLYVFLYRGINLPAYNNDPTAYTIYQNIILTKKNRAVLDLKGEQVRAEAPGVDRKRKADEETIKLGDQSSAKVMRTVRLTENPPTYQYLNVYYFRYGALLRYDGTTYTATEEWLPWGANPNDPTAWKKIQQHLAIGQLEMTGKPARVFTGELLQRDPSGQRIGPLDLVHMEELDTPEGNCYMVPFRGWEWDMKRNIISIDAVEILNVPGVTIKNYWDSPDGIIPMGDPTDPPKVPNRQKLIFDQLTPGKLQQILDKPKSGEVGPIGGFTYNPAHGIPVEQGTTFGNKIRGMMVPGQIIIYK